MAVAHFGGYATRYDIKCADGRTIRKNAFRDCDGMTVPLVYGHNHNDIEGVLGHGQLECRDDGVYVYGTFNNTSKGLAAKEAVKNHDLTSLSIFANHLKQNAGDVMHGEIKEVSLVLAGANPGAYIDSIMYHSDDGNILDDQCIAWTEENIIDYVEHDDISSYDDSDLSYEELNDIINEIQHADDEETVGDVLNTLNEKQKRVVMALIAEALKNDSAEHSDIEEEINDMSYNAFESTYGETIQHERGWDESDVSAAFDDAKQYGSLKQSFIAHGIVDLEFLFPDDRNVSPYPSLIQRDQGWVQGIMSGVHHVPFSRIRSVHANITEDEARAKGYIKGNFKKEEFFKLLRRSTEPKTVYKKQKLDKDDITDITTLDVVAWLKKEMRLMLDEELARAYLIGDGRSDDDEDKIDEDKIRPIAKDADLYTIKVEVNAGNNPDRSSLTKEFIKSAIRSRKQYKGSGNPTLYTTEDVLTEMLLLEDGIGHDLYDSEEKLARKLRVNKIVTVPVMENQTGFNGGELMGIIVNLNDYTVGADKGGSVEMFDDFDIDFNQYKYLIETRCSGALTLPYSAIVLCSSVINPLSSIYLTPENSTTTILGKSVGSLQKNVNVSGTSVTGTLKYVTNYTGYSGSESEQSGNYLAMKVNGVPEDATVKIYLVGGTSQEVILDDDMNFVARITNPGHQYIRIRSTVSGFSSETKYSLTSVVLESN